MSSQTHRPLLLAISAAILAIQLLLPIPLASCFGSASATKPENEGSPAEIGEQMANQYTHQLQIILQLMEEPTNLDVSSRNSILSEGQSAFDRALEVFPDDTLPHAHALFAKLCVRIEKYEKSLELFDEAIRRVSIPLESSEDSSADNDDDDDDRIRQNSREIQESEALAKQLILERNRAHFSHLQLSVNKWDAANNALHRGGIPPETSPLDPLSVVESQLNVFPNPHPQSLFDKASFLVLLLDSPSEDESVNRTAEAWEAHDTYKKAQTWAFGAYAHGKKRGLAGGRPCKGEDSGFGVAVGGRAWKNYASESHPFPSSESEDVSDFFAGVVSLPSAIVSGKDAVISGYGDNCLVYVPHRYVNLADNLPMVTSWESNVMELTVGDNPLWLTHIPSNDINAYGGRIGKDASGNDALIIPNPKPRSAKHGFDSAVLLTGYASDNYYHFVGEVLPSLVVMKDRVEDVLAKSNGESKGSAKDIILIPSLQNEFVEGFLRLLLPAAWSNGTLSKHVVQWGASRRSANATKYLVPHPIAYVRRLYAATWDQPKHSPPPVAGAAHCLTPGPLLKAMQLAVWNAVDDLRGGTRDYPRVTVVYCPRASSPTRSLKQESELLARLRESVSALGGEVIVFEKQSPGINGTSSDQSPLQFVMDSVELFRSAAVVVGVHGASLANIAFSRRVTTVVEMGFRSLPQASHYRHLASSLGLKHVNVWLERDARSLGATQVELQTGGVQEVVDAVVAVLKQVPTDQVRDEL